MVTKLTARTSILAAMNPTGRFDPEQPLEMNTGLPAPLLSRFDIVLLFLDGMNPRRCGFRHFVACRQSPLLDLFMQKAYYHAETFKLPIMSCICRTSNANREIPAHARALVSSVGRLPPFGSISRG
jgi:hypothetical protein